MSGPAEPIPAPLAAQAAPSPEPVSARSRGRVRTLLGSLGLPTLAIFTAFVVGALVIILSDRATLPLWTTDPIKALGDSLRTVFPAYPALLTGSLGDPGRIAGAISSGNPSEVARAFTPISETVLNATPLIFTGLAVALGFRSGLFNIGAEGQLYAGAIFATYVGFAIGGLPWFVHLPLALLAGFVGGGLWGFIPGILKARTGANEVITTIMLNYVAYRLVDFVLKTSVFQRPGRSDPISKLIEPSAYLPQFVNNPALRAHWGIVVALLAAVAVSWLLFRSTRGFELRAVGLNAQAARYAGMSIGATLTLTLAISGGLAGLAGTSVILGSSHTLTAGFSPGYGFDAIALALLGRSRPSGVVAAAFLFGALRAGATPMQSATGIPIDLVVVVQALVIMFVAAPALVRGIYRIPVGRPAARAALSKGTGS